MICWNVPFPWPSMTRSYPKGPHLPVFGTDGTSNLGHKLTVASPNLQMANPSHKGRGQCHATFFSFEASSYRWNMWHYALLTWYTEWTRSKHQKLSPTESWWFFLKFWAPILTWEQVKPGRSNLLYRLSQPSTDDVQSLLLFGSADVVFMFVSVKRNHSTDYPVLGFFAYVGNDVCNWWVGPHCHKITLFCVKVVNTY